MTDLELIEKKLAFIETCVRELRQLGRPDAIDTDVREERFIAHTLQIAIQAALDVASHIVSDQRLGEPQTNTALFDLLTKAGWMPAGLAQTVRQITGFRNVVVHGYQALDRDILKDIVENRLDDLLAYVSAIRTRLAHSGHRSE
jgi:uncharacterized protein YutE (UPF0331/DUF86 family)